MREFTEDGVSFRYPDDWTLEREDAEGGWTVSVQSPGTAFFVLACDAGMPTAEDMAEAALEALRGEYPGLEAEPCVDRIAGQAAVGHDIQFFAMDLTNSCWTRGFYGEAGTLFLMCQVSDVEADTYEPALRGICASLRVDEG